jgi:hypothetical protein
MDQQQNLKSISKGQWLVQFAGVCGAVAIVGAIAVFVNWFFDPGIQSLLIGFYMTVGAALLVVVGFLSLLTGWLIDRPPLRKLAVSATLLLASLAMAAIFFTYVIQNLSFKFFVVSVNNQCPKAVTLVVTGTSKLPQKLRFRENSASRRRVVIEKPGEARFKLMIEGVEKQSGVLLGYVRSGPPQKVSGRISAQCELSLTP